MFESEELRELLKIISYFTQQRRFTIYLRSILEISSPVPSKLNRGQHTPRPRIYPARSNRGRRVLVLHPAAAARGWIMPRYNRARPRWSALCGSAVRSMGAGVRLPRPRSIHLYPSLYQDAIWRLAERAIYSSVRPRLFFIVSLSPRPWLPTISSLNFRWRISCSSLIRQHGTDFWSRSDMYHLWVSSSSSFFLTRKIIIIPRLLVIRFTLGFMFGEYNNCTLFDV